MEKRIEDVDIIWVDDEACGIKCPNCGNKDLIISIYADNIEPCVCGKKYYFHQLCPVFEVTDDN